MWGGKAYIGVSFRKKQDKSAPGDMIGGFEYEVKSKSGKDLANVIAIMAIDGLTCADQEAHFANVKKYRPKMS